MKVGVYRELHVLPVTASLNRYPRAQTPLGGRGHQVFSNPGMSLKGEFEAGSADGSFSG